MHTFIPFLFTGSSNAGRVICHLLLLFELLVQYNIFASLRVVLAGHIIGCLR